jgi:hypothetical protein
VERGRGSGPFQAAKALFVHFGAIKMDIGIGIDLNEWREQTRRMKEAGTDVPFGGWQGASPKKLYITGVKPKGH